MSLLKCCAYLQLFIIHSIEQREALDKARGNCALKVIDENLYVLLQYFFSSSFLLYFTKSRILKKKRLYEIKKDCFT